MVGRGELTAEAWGAISPLFPANGHRGGQWRDQRAQRASRPLIFDTIIYARRNVVERCIYRLRQWRGLVTRYEKRGVTYRAMFILASIVLWLEG